MQTYSVLMKRSPSNNDVPSDRSIRINENQASPTNTSGVSDSPGTPNQNLAPNKDSFHSRLCPESSTNASAVKRALDSLGAVHTTLPGANHGSPSIRPLTCSCEFIRRHAFKIQNPTVDEISIIHLAFLVGWDNAEELAPSMNLKSDRPLRSLLTC